MRHCLRNAALSAASFTPSAPSKSAAFMTPSLFLANRRAPCARWLLRSLSYRFCAVHGRVSTGQRMPPFLQLDHLRSFPFCLKPVRIVRKALASEGHPGLAGALCAALGEIHHKRFGGKAGRRSWREAARHWCQTKGMRRKAWTAAWRARSPNCPSPLLPTVDKPCPP